MACPKGQERGIILMSRLEECSKVHLMDKVFEKGKNPYSTWIEISTKLIKSGVNKRVTPVKLVSKTKRAELVHSCLLRHA